MGMTYFVGMSWDWLVVEVVNDVDMLFRMC